MNQTQILAYLKKSLKLTYDDPSVIFSWELISLDNNQIKLKLNFDNPLLISQTDVNTLIFKSFRKNLHLE